MNKVILMGRLCNDPEISTAQNGNVIAKYRLAVNRDYKKEGQPEADFLNCVAFGRSADFVRNFLHKGIKIAVEGRIQTGSYEKDGIKHYTTDIIADRHEFCESKSTNASVRNDEELPLPHSDVNGYVEVYNEDLPF